MPHLVLPAPVIGQQAAGGSNVFMLVMFAALALLLFMSFRRGKKAQSEQAKMRSSLTPGQEVMTSAGIFGTVVSVDEAQQRVTLEIAPGTHMQVHLQGIGQVVEPVEQAVAETDSGAPAGSTAAPVVREDAAPAETVRTDADVDRADAERGTLLNGQEYRGDVVDDVDPRTDRA